MRHDTGFMQIGGVRLEYVWCGPAAEARPTILLLHEGLGSVSAWRDFPERLSQATGCGVLAYSRQGYGRSDPVELPRPLSYMHDEAFDVVPRIIDRWQLRKVFLVGHSDGASIATIYAGGVQDHRVRGIVLMTPHFFNEEICIEGIEAARRAYETGDLKGNLERHHGANTEVAFYGWNRAWLDPGFRHWTIEEYLPYIRVPLLMIWCSKDCYASEAQARAARESCTCPLEEVRLDECTHWPFREQPDETMTSIEAFLNRLIQVHGERVTA